MVKYHMPLRYAFLIYFNNLNFIIIPDFILMIKI